MDIMTLSFDQDETFRKSRAKVVRESGRKGGLRLWRRANGAPIRGKISIEGVSCRQSVDRLAHGDYVITVISRARQGRRG